MATIGKYAATAAVGMIVLIVGIVGATTFGIPGLGGGVVDGTVYADAAGEEPRSNVTVTPEPTGTSDESADTASVTTETTDDGEFSFEDVSEGEYVLSVESADGLDYGEISIDVPGNTTDLESVPAEATMSGEVVDAETGEPLPVDGDSGVDATIKHIDEDGRPIANGTGGSDELTVTDLDARYTLSADADGYGTVERSIDSFGVQDSIELESAGAALSGKVTETSGTTIDATVRVVVAAGDVQSTRTDLFGEYEISGLLSGEEYRVEVVADGYETEVVNIDFSDGDVKRSFELQAS